MSRSVCCDFTEKFELHIFWQENWQETEWTKILRTDSVEKFNKSDLLLDKKKSQKAAIVIHETHVMNQKISEFLK